MKNRGRILAVDFGRSKVGLAVCDEERKLVFRRGIIKGFGSLDRLFRQLKDLCVKEKIVLVLFGVPLGIEGNETAQSAKIRVIGEKLRAYLEDIFLEFVDESFSTFEAKELLAGVPGRIDMNDDDYAAYLLLVKYLKQKEAF